MSTGCNCLPPKAKESAESVTPFAIFDAAALGKEYYAALNNATKFLDFSLTET